MHLITLLLLETLLPYIARRNMHLIPLTLSVAAEFDQHVKVSVSRDPPVGAALDVHDTAYTLATSVSLTEGEYTRPCRQKPHFRQLMTLVGWRWVLLRAEPRANTAHSCLARLFVICRRWYWPLMLLCSPRF